MKNKKPEKKLKYRPTTDGTVPIYRKKKKRKLTTQGKIIILCGVLLLALVATGVALYNYLFGSMNRTNISKDHSELNIDDSFFNKYKDSDIANIAVFGDANKDNTHLSDTIMIVSLDMKNKNIKITSIARDTLVPIDGYGKTNKINAAYNKGGALLAIKTINQNFKMNIEDYVTINMTNLSKVIDKAGGVTVTINEAERVMANGIMDELTPKSAKIQKSGAVNLTGDQAVAYSRIRKIDSDYARMQRQRNVLQSLFSKALKLNPIDLANTIHEFMPMVETSLSNQQILYFAQILANKHAELIEMSFPNKTTKLNPNYKINGIDYVIYDLPTASQQLHDFIYNNVKLEVLK